MQQSCEGDLSKSFTFPDSNLANGLQPVLQDQELQNGRVICEEASRAWAQARSSSTDEEDLAG